MSSVLFDEPGPRARRRNRVIAVAFVLALAGLLSWILLQFADKDILTVQQWRPFTQLSTWREFVWPGLRNTLKAAGLAIVFALVLGLVLGTARLSDHQAVRWIAGTLVELFRAVPVLMMMVFWWAVYTYRSNIAPSSVPLYAVVTGLTLYNGAVLAEVFRAGVRAVPRGQTEAGYAVGLRKTQLMTSVLLPQAVTTMLPSIISQLVVTLKDTALGGLLVIGFVELLRTADSIKGNYGNVVPSYIVIGALYIALNLVVSQLARYLEYRLRRGRRRGAPRAPAPVVGEAELVT